VADASIALSLEARDASAQWSTGGTRRSDEAPELLERRRAAHENSIVDILAGHGLAVFRQPANLVLDRENRVPRLGGQLRSNGRGIRQALRADGRRDAPEVDLPAVGLGIFISASGRCLSLPNASGSRWSAFFISLPPRHDLDRPNFLPSAAERRSELEARASAVIPPPLG
jgi:hypothetical protein